MVANKTSKYIWTYQWKVGTSYITIADTVDGAPAGNVCTMTSHNSTIANDLAGHKMIGITGDNVGTVFTVVSNTAASPTLVTLSGTPATPADLAGDTVSFQQSFEFGEYNNETGKWNTPFIENPSQPSWVYNTRTPTLTDLEAKFPNFTHTFLPTTAQVFAWMQGNPVLNGQSVDITSLETDMTYPLTVRLEEAGGTKEEVIQAVDCYCVGLTTKGERGEGKSLLVEAEFAYGKLEDYSVDAIPLLTRVPLMPGEGMTNPYNGNPIVMWDIGGDNVSVPGIERVDWTEKREVERVSSGGGTTETVYTYKLKPVQIILGGVFTSTDDIWEDYKNRKVSTNMTIKFFKHNNTNWVMATFTNCRIITVKKLGDKNKGHYAVIVALIAEKVTYTNDWVTEGGANFSTHWKADI